MDCLPIVFLIAFLTQSDPFAAVDRSAVDNSTAIVADETGDILTIASEPPPKWRWSADAIYFKRRRMDERTFVVAPAGRPALLTTTDFTTPFELGGKFAVARSLDEQYEFEAVGFFDTGFTDSASITRPAGTMIQPFFNQTAYGPPTPMIGGMPARVDLLYQSQLFSIEMNARWNRSLADWLRFGLLSGVRYFDFDDQFQNLDSLTSVPGANPADTVYRTRAYNHMIGGQLGGMLELRPIEQLRILSETKWAGFANFTDGINELALQNGSVTFFRGSTTETRFSGIVDFALSAGWQFNRWLEIRAGYQAMYFWNMTSSPDIISFNLLQLSKTNNELAFWVHGPTAGLTIKY